MLEDEIAMRKQHGALREIGRKMGIKYCVECYLPGASGEPELCDICRDKQKPTSRLINRLTRLFGWNKSQSERKE